MKKNISIILILALLLFSLQNVSAWFQTVLIESKAKKIEEVIQYSKQEVIIQWDLKLSENIYGTKKLIVHWDLKIKWTGLHFINDVIVYWDVYIEDRTEFHGKLIAHNIEWNNYISIADLEAKGNVNFGTHVEIKNWMFVSWDFESGSKWEFHGKTLVEWNMKVGANTNITGVLYVNKSFQWNYYFDFNGIKIRILWDFKVNKYSKVEARIYMYAGQWHRYLHGYWNEIYKYRYDTVNRQYSNRMKIIDPVLDYKISQSEINKINKVVSYYDFEIKQKKKYIEKLSSKRDKNYLIHGELLQLKAMHEKLFSYVLKYVWDTNWDKTYLKNAEAESYNEMKIFIYKYGSGLDFE